MFNFNNFKGGIIKNSMMQDKMDERETKKIEERS